MRGFVVVDVAIHAVPLVRTLDVAVQLPGLVAPSEAVVILLLKRALHRAELFRQMVLMECRMHHL